MSKRKPPAWQPAVPPPPREPFRASEGEHAAAEQSARELKTQIVWAKYPKLAEVFEHRPAVNVYWIELARLIRELRSS